MSEQQDIQDYSSMGKLIARFTELLDTIKGGAIRTMQAQFDALVSEKKTALDNFLGQQYGRVSSVLNDVHGELPHVLLTPNQALETVNSTSISGFSTIYCQSLEVTKEATIRGGSVVDHTGRGVGADFRASVIGQAYSNGTFNILRVKFKRAATGHPARIHDFWNNGNMQGAMTGAAIVKVVSGSLYGWPVQVAHSNGWETRGAQHVVNSRDGNLSNNHNHESINMGASNIPSDEGEFLICLYGVVNGVVDFDKWGLFPELDKSWKV